MFREINFLIKWPFERRKAPGNVGLDFERISPRDFQIDFFPNHHFFSLIFTEWLRIRLFSTYIITMLSVAICSKKKISKNVRAPKMASLSSFSYCISYKVDIHKSFSSLSKFHLGPCRPWESTFPLLWLKTPHPSSSSLVQEVEIWAQLLSLGTELFTTLMPRKNER